MVQRDFPSTPYLRKGHTFGSLQQAPQRIHRPLRLVDTGRIEVKVRFILASQVFCAASAISRDFVHISQHTIRRTPS